MGGGWNPIRNAIETVGSLAGNWELPGSSLITDKLVSKGSQGQLGSPLGTIAQIGTGLAGSGAFGQGLQSTGGAFEQSALNSIANSLGLGGSTGGATGASTIPTTPTAPGAAGSSPAVSTSGGGVGGATATAAPASVPSNFGGDVTQQFQQALSPSTAISSPGIDSLVSQATPAASAAAPAASSSPNSGVALLKSLTSGSGIGDAFKNFLSSNANLAVPAGVLGYEATQAKKMPSEFNAVESQAKQLGAQGEQLASYLQSGQLPEGLQTAVNQNLAAEQAAIKSRYAAMGMSGSSAEQQDLANAASRSQAQSATIATDLLSQGINETGQSAGLYQNLLQNIMASDKGLSDALSAFASAAGGAPGKTTNP